MQSTYEKHTELVEKIICLNWTVNNTNDLLQTLKSTEYIVTSRCRTCFFVYHQDKTGNYYEVFLEKCNELDNSKPTAYVFNLGMKVPVSSTGDRTEKTVDYKKTYFYNCYREPTIFGNTKKFFLEIRYLESKEIVEPSFEKILPYTYEKFLKDQELCDIVFLIGTEQIKAHTVILAAASPYFLAMFKNKDMVENTNRKVDLSNDNDVTIQNFQGFLDFIYGCKSIDELSMIAYELLVLADKFDVKQLHQASEQYIIKNITEENLTKILMISDRYNCKTLQAKAINFAKLHIDKVKNSDDFKDLCKITDMMRRLL